MKNPLIFTLLYILMMGIGMAIMHYGAGYSYGDPEMVLVLFWIEVVVTIMIIWWVTRYSSWREVGFSRLNKKALWWLLPMAVLIFLGGIEFLNLTLLKEQWFLFSTIGLTTMMVGFSEEVLFRGIVLHHMMEKYPLYKVMLISAIAFSLLHSVNIFGGLTLWVMLFQLVFTFIFGLLFAPLAIKLNSLWPLIILHWQWDFVLFSSKLSLSEEPSSMLPMLPIMIIEIVFLWRSILKNSN